MKKSNIQIISFIYFGILFNIYSQNIFANDYSDREEIQSSKFLENWYRTGIDNINGDYTQGCANDGKYWYFSYTTRLYKTTQNYKLIASNESAIPVVALKAATGYTYDHIGDIDYFDGKLYIPLEDENRQNPVLCAFDTTNLEFTGEYYSMKYGAQTHCSWIAADTASKYFYTAIYYKNVDTLHVFDSQKNFAYIDDVILERTITKIQGGVFYDGYLYLTCDCGGEEGFSTDNVYRVDVNTGSVDLIIYFPNTHELEGLDAFKMESGSLHIMSETGETNNLFFHYEKPEIMDHNLRISRIKSPESSLPIFTEVIPEITVHNIGESNELNVDAYCVVDDSLGNEVFQDKQEISKISAYDSVKVQFNTWMPTESNYTILFYTDLSTDMQPDNDSLIRNVRIQNIFENFNNDLDEWSCDDGWVLSVGKDNTTGLASDPRPYENNVNLIVSYDECFSLVNTESAGIGLWTKNRLEEDHDYLYIEASEDQENWEIIGQMTGQQLSWEQSFYSLKSFNGKDNVYIRFRLVTDDSGTDSGIRIDDIGLYSGIVNSTDTEQSLIQTYELKQNYPNPFNASTMIEYQLPSDVFVTLEIYNLLGCKVRTLVNEYQSAGAKYLSWNGVNDNGETLCSGVYFLRLATGDFHYYRKMILLK